MKELVLYKDDKEFIFELLEYKIQQHVNNFNHIVNLTDLYIRIKFNNNIFFHDFQKSKFDCKIMEDDSKSLIFYGCLISEINYDFGSNNTELYINPDYFNYLEDTLTQVRVKKIKKIFNENIDTHQ